MDQIIGYIVPEKFTGCCLTVLCKKPDGREYVGYSKLPLTEYLAQNAARGARLVSPAEFDALHTAHLDSLVSAPKVITEERFFDSLEVLPPCRWCTVCGVELFHVAERITCNLVTWCAKYEGVYFEFTDYDDKPGQELAEKVKAAYLASFKS